MTHPYIIDTSFKRLSVQDVKKNQWDDEVARCSQGNGRAQDQLGIYNRSWEDASKKENSESDREENTSEE